MNESNNLKELAR